MQAIDFKWSLIVVFYPSLPLAHLERSCFSLSKQTVKPDELIFFDYGSPFPSDYVEGIVEPYLKNVQCHIARNVPEREQTMSFCLNKAIRLSTNEIFVLAKADMIYDWPFCEKVLLAQGGNPDVFSSTWQFQMPYYSGANHRTVNHAADLEPLGWRDNPQNLLINNNRAGELKNTEGDAAAFCTSKYAMELAGWYDENLTFWGVWQMSLQRAMSKRGIQFKIVPEFLHFHMCHAIKGGEDQIDETVIEEPMRGRAGQASAAYEEWRNSPNSSL